MTRGDWRGAVREFLYGMSSYEHERLALEARQELETLLLAVVYGDMVGVPVLPPYYALRLLPHVTPFVRSWKVRVLRERWLGDSHEHDLHGV